MSGPPSHDGHLGVDVLSFACRHCAGPLLKPADVASGDPEAGRIAIHVGTGACYHRACLEHTQAREQEAREKFLDELVSRAPHRVSPEQLGRLRDSALWRDRYERLGAQMIKPELAGPAESDAWAASFDLRDLPLCLDPTLFDAPGFGELQLVYHFNVDSHREALTRTLVRRLHRDFAHSGELARILCYDTPPSAESHAAKRACEGVFAILHATNEGDYRLYLRFRASEAYRREKLDAEAAGLSLALGSQPAFLSARELRDNCRALGREISRSVAASLRLLLVERALEQREALEPVTGFESASQFGEFRPVLQRARGVDTSLTRVSALDDGTFLLAHNCVYPGMMGNPKAWCAMGGDASTPLLALIDPTAADSDTLPVPLVLQPSDLSQNRNGEREGGLDAARRALRFVPANRLCAAELSFNKAPP